MKVPAVLIALCISFAGCGGGSSTPTTPSTPAPVNRNPVIASVNVSPTFAVAYLSPITFSAVASDPDGDALTYSWKATSSFRGDLGSGSGATWQTIFSPGFTDGQAKLTVSDGKGGSATADSVKFVNGSMNWDWMVTTPTMPGVALFYLRLVQDSTGRVDGLILTASEQTIGRTDSASPGRIDALGRLTNLRLKWDNGADVVIAGQMQSDGGHVIGNFTDGNATINGVRLRGLTAILEID